MKKLLFVFLLSPCAFSQDIWVMGKTYLLHRESGKTHILKNRKPDSWGYDHKNCRLWITENRVLYSLDRQKRIPRGETLKILSDMSATFLTLGLDGKVELRDLSGKTLKSFPAPWPVLPISIVLAKDLNFALIQEGNHLFLSIYDSEFKKISETTISQNRDFWNTPVLKVDEKTESVWIGYTVTQPWTIYAPVMEKRNFKGELLFKQEWKERGVLFDACLTENGEALVSRDIPSNSGYTVPVHSFLEEVTPAKSPKPLFAHQENLFIDSLSCQADKIVFVSRSIFGSDGSTVEVWDKTPKEMSKTLFKLPDPAWKIYACPVQSLF